MMQANDINDLLRDRTLLNGITISWREGLSWYDVAIGLGRDDAEHDHLTLLCQNAGKIRVADIGPGRSQVLALRVKDVRDRQWDRVTFEVEDLGRSAVYLMCQSIEVLPDLSGSA